MVKFPNIVPICHKLNSGEKYFDGTGFIFNTFSGISVFATCWHNFKESGLSKSYIIYNGEEIEIKRDPNKYFEGNGGFIPTTYFKTGIVDDYAFYILDFIIENPLQLEMKEISDQQIILVTHNDKGDQIILECQNYKGPNQRYNMEGIPFSINASNLKEIDCNKAVKGNSGGVILDLESKKCFGFLHGERNQKDFIWIIKSNTILERLLKFTVL